MLQKAGCLPMVLALMACGAQTAQQQDMPAAGANSVAAIFACDNGMQVAIQQRGVDAVNLEVGAYGTPEHQSVILQRDVAASGDRYTVAEGFLGGGAEWHQKGDEAYFAFIDQTGAQQQTPCRLK